MREWKVFLVMLQCCLVGALISFTQPVFADTIDVVNYNFDEGSGTIATDRSGNGNDGILNNGPTWVSGKVGTGALSFDGVDDYVSIPSTATSGVSKFGMEFWVKTTEADTGAIFWQRPTLVGQATSSPSSGDFGITTNKGYIGFWTGLNSGGDNSYLSTTTKINDNLWHFIRVINDGAQATLYVDGAVQGTLATGLSLNSTEFWIGGLNSTESPGHYHGGTIDEFRFYFFTNGSVHGEIPLDSIVLTNQAGLKWSLQKFSNGWALGNLYYHKKPVEAQTTEGMLFLRNVTTGAKTWVAASGAQTFNSDSVKFSGQTQVGGVNFSFDMTIGLKNDLPVAAMNTRWSVSNNLSGWEVCFTYHNNFVSSWRCQMYPFAGNSSTADISPLQYCGVPGAVMYRPDMSMMTFFFTDMSFDYLNNTTWTRNAGFHFQDGVTSPQFRIGNGSLSSAIQYFYPLQVIVSDSGESSKNITDVVKTWIKVSGYQVQKAQYVRSVQDAFSIYIAGRRATTMWHPEFGGYELQQGCGFSYIGTVPTSAYFDYNVFIQTGDSLWRQRAFDQMAFALKAQVTNQSDPNYGMCQTTYWMSSSTFNSQDRGHIGWKPDINGHIARYMLLTWELVKQKEGVNHTDWYNAGVHTADWIMKQTNPDSGLPQSIASGGVKSVSVNSSRTLVAMPAIARITGDSRYLDFAGQLERFVQKNVEGRLWFTGFHPDLYPADYDGQGVWNNVEYWLDKYDRTQDAEALDRALADFYYELLTQCPRQLSWVGNPTQCGVDEQEGYHQYTVYCYHGRMLQDIYRLWNATKNDLFRQLYNRLLQLNFYTQVASGANQGCFYEAICDPWLARGCGYNCMGTLYLNELSLDLMIQETAMGMIDTIAPPAVRISAHPAAVPASNDRVLCHAHGTTLSCILPPNESFQLIELLRTDGRIMSLSRINKSTGNVLRFSIKAPGLVFIRLLRLDGTAVIRKAVIR